ncbi:uncharacterized protein LOC117338798 [Pecten maximus]|uniref:uncharacterized protein LOC117338798 n=1 Tax=Pecten maximus TaxID=6579 RepID=UPI001458495E|nr:uncharacterized protein LOC117338798 [Pecten maximus]
MSARTRRKYWQNRSIDDNLLKQVAHSPKPSTSDDVSPSSKVGYGAICVHQKVEIGHTHSSDHISTFVDEDPEGLYNLSDVKIGLNPNALSDQQELNQDISENKHYSDLTNLVTDYHVDNPAMESGKKSSTPSSDSKLVKKKQRNQSGTFQCDICDRTYKYYFDMRRHVRDNHVKTLKQCKGNKALTEKVKAYVKKNIPYKCKVCGSLYSTPKGLSLHMKVIHSAKLPAKSKSIKDKTARSKDLISLLKNAKSKTSVKSQSPKGNKKDTPDKESPSPRKKTVQPKVPSNGTLVHPKSSVSSPSIAKSPPIKNSTKLSGNRSHPIEVVFQKKEKKLRCKLCQKIYGTRTGILYHLKITHLYCSACYKQFCYQKVYDKHMEFKHNQHQVVVDDHYFSNLSKANETTISPEPKNANREPCFVDKDSEGLKAQECTTKKLPAKQNYTSELAVPSVTSSLNTSNAVKIPEGTVLSPLKIKLNRLPSDPTALKDLSMRYEVVPINKSVKKDNKSLDENSVKNAVFSSPQDKLVSTQNISESDSSFEKPVTRPKMGPKSKTQKSTIIRNESNVLELHAQPVTVSNKGKVVKFIDETDECNSEISVVMDQESHSDNQNFRKTRSRPFGVRKGEKTNISASEAKLKDSSQAAVNDHQIDTMETDDFNTEHSSCMEDAKDIAMKQLNTSTKQSTLQSSTSAERVTRSSSQPAARGNTLSVKRSHSMPGNSSLSSTEDLPYDCPRNSTAMRSSRPTNQKDSSKCQKPMHESRTLTKSLEHLTSSSLTTHSARNPSLLRRDTNSESSQLTHSTRNLSLRTRKATTSESSQSTHSTRNLSPSPRTETDATMESSLLTSSSRNLSLRTRKVTTSESSAEFTHSTRRPLPSPVTDTTTESFQLTSSTRNPSLQTRKASSFESSTKLTNSIRNSSLSPSTRKDTESSQLTSSSRNVSLSSRKKTTSESSISFTHSSKDSSPLLPTTTDPEPSSVSSRKSVHSSEIVASSSQLTGKNNTLDSPSESTRNNLESGDTNHSQTKPSKEKKSCEETDTRRLEDSIEHSTLHSRSKITSVYNHDIRELMFGKSCSASDLHVDDKKSPEHHEDFGWKIVTEERSYDLNKLTLKITRNVKTGMRSVKTQQRFLCNLSGLKLKIVRDFSQQKRTVLSDEDGKNQRETDQSDTSAYSTSQTISTGSLVDELSSDVENDISSTCHTLHSSRTGDSASSSKDSDDFTSPRKTDIKSIDRVPYGGYLFDEGILNSQRTPSSNRCDGKTSYLMPSDDITESSDNEGHDDPNSQEKNVGVNRERKLRGNLDVTNSEETTFVDIDEKLMRHTKGNSKSSLESVQAAVANLIGPSGDHVPNKTSPKPVEGQALGSDNIPRLCSNTSDDLLKHVKERGVAKVLLEQLQDSMTLQDPLVKKRNCVTKLNRPAPASVKKQRLLSQVMVVDSDECCKSELKNENVTVTCQTSLPSGAFVDEIDGECIGSPGLGEFPPENLTNLDRQKGPSNGNGTRVLKADMISQYLLKGFNESDLDILLNQSLDDRDESSDQNVDVTLSDDGLYATVHSQQGDKNNNQFKGEVLKEIMGIIQFANPGLFQMERELEKSKAGLDNNDCHRKLRNMNTLEKKYKVKSAHRKLKEDSAVTEQESKDSYVKNIDALELSEKLPEANIEEMILSSADECEKGTEIGLINKSIAKTGTNYAGPKDWIPQNEESSNISEKEKKEIPAPVNVNLTEDRPETVQQSLENKPSKTNATADVLPHLPKCSVCGDSFPSVKSLESHQVKCHPEKLRKLQKFACKFCGMIYAQKQNVKRHVKSRHSEILANSLEAFNDVCEVIDIVCDQSTNHHNSDDIYDVNIQYHCLICNMIYKKRSSVLCHIKSSHKKRDLLYKHVSQCYVSSKTHPDSLMESSENSKIQCLDTNCNMDESEAAVHNLLESFGEDVSTNRTRAQDPDVLYMETPKPMTPDSEVMRSSEMVSKSTGFNCQEYNGKNFSEEVGQVDHGSGDVCLQGDLQDHVTHGDQQDHVTHENLQDHVTHGDQQDHGQSENISQEVQGDQRGNTLKHRRDACECHVNLEQEQQGNEHQKVTGVLALVETGQNSNIVCPPSETTSPETSAPCSEVEGESRHVEEDEHEQNFPNAPHGPMQYMCKSDDKICEEVAHQTGLTIHQNSVVRIFRLPSHWLTADSILKPEGSVGNVFLKRKTVSGDTESNHVTSPPNEAAQPVSCKEDHKQESILCVKPIGETQYAALLSARSKGDSKQRFICDLCGFSYTSKANLKRHFITKHSDQVTSSDEALNVRLEKSNSDATDKEISSFTHIQTIGETTSVNPTEKSGKMAIISSADSEGQIELRKSTMELTDGSGNKDTSEKQDGQLVIESNNQLEVLKENLDNQLDIQQDDQDIHTDLVDKMATQPVLNSTIPNTNQVPEASDQQPGKEKKLKGSKHKKDKSRRKLMKVKVPLIGSPASHTITEFEMAISTPAQSQRKLKKRKLDRQTSAEEGPSSKRPSSTDSKTGFDKTLQGVTVEKTSCEAQECFQTPEEDVFSGDTEMVDGLLNVCEIDTEIQSGSETSPRKSESPRKPKKSIDKIVQGIIQRHKDMENKKSQEKLDPPEVDFPAPFEEILARCKGKAVKSAEVSESTGSLNDENSNSSFGSQNNAKLSVKPIDIFSSLRTGPSVKFGKSFRKIPTQTASTDEERQFKSPLDRVGAEVPMKFGATQERKKVGEATAKPIKQSNKNYLIDILKDIPSIYDCSKEEGRYVSPWDNPSVSEPEKSVIGVTKPPVFSKTVHFVSDVNNRAPNNSVHKVNNETSNKLVRSNVSDISNEDMRIEVSDENVRMKIDNNCQKIVDTDEEDSLEKGLEFVSEEIVEENNDGVTMTTKENAEEKQYFSSLPDEDDNKLTIVDGEKDENLYEDENDEDTDDGLRKNDRLDDDEPEDDQQSDEDEEDEENKDSDNHRNSDREDDYPNDEEETKDSDSEMEVEEFDFLSPSEPPLKRHEKNVSDEERDILSIDYDSDEASFLDDAGSIASRKSVSKRRSLAAVESELEAIEVSSVAVSAMDLASESSLVQSKIQCNPPPVLTPAVISKAVTIFLTGGGYCYSFLRYGYCRRRDTCRYQHTIPPLDWFFRRGQATILDSREKPDIKRAFEVYHLLKTLNVRPITRDIIEVLLNLAVNAWDTDAAFQLFGDMKATDLINDMTSVMLVRLCSSSPQNYTDQLWALFQVVLEKNLKLGGDCIDTIVQGFSMRRDYSKLLEVLYYSNNIPEYVVPVHVLHMLLITCLKFPEEYLPATTKWAETCNQNLLRQLEPRILVDLYDTCVKHNNRVLCSLLERLTSTMLPVNQGEPPEITDILDEQDWNGDSVGENVMTSSDEYKGRQHRIRGCKLTKNWEHLGSIFVELCCDLELSNPNYIQEYVYVLTDSMKPETMAENFKLFLQAIHKEMETKMADNMDVLDEPSLARIGAGLLQWCYKEGQWEQGYHLLFVMHQTRVYYYKCTGKGTIGTALIAMEICLNTNNPDSALQILERSKGQILTSENPANVTRILNNLFDKLLEKSYTKMAFTVLVIFLEKREQDQAPTDLSLYFNCLVQKSLLMSDIHTALGVFKIQKETDNGKLNVLCLRGLLTACGKHMFDNKYIEEVYKSCIVRKLYPPHRFDMPRSILLSSMMTPVEMYLYISDYLNILYNSVCDSVMEGVHLTMDHFCLSIHVWWEEDRLQQLDFPYLSLALHTQQQVWQMALYVLHKDINPPLKADYNSVSNCIFINPESLYNYLQVKDGYGRKQGLHIQTGTLGPVKIRGQAWARPNNFSNQRRGRPYR